MGKDKVKKKEPEEQYLIYKMWIKIFAKKGSKVKVEIHQSGVPNNPPPYVPKP